MCISKIVELLRLIIIKETCLDLKKINIYVHILMYKICKKPKLGTNAKTLQNEIYKKIY